MRDGRVSKEMALEDNSAGGVCGVQEFQLNIKKWAVGCEFDERNATNTTTTSSASNCAKICYDYKEKCLSYSWSWKGTMGLCHLHDGNDTQAFLVNSDNNICGIRPRVADNSTYPRVGKHISVYYWNPIYPG